MMRKIVSYIASIVLLVLAGIVITLLHPVQVLAHRIGGYTPHKRVVEFSGSVLMKLMILMGTIVKYSGKKNIPTNRPLIIISNHQSTMDIPPIVLAMKKYHPKFIAKKELGKNFPSVSYNLNHGGSVLIDRNNQAQSIREIIKLGKYIEENNYSAVIFPEGTRSRDGQLKEFQLAGIKALLRAVPSALVVPFAIDGNYKLHKYGYFPFHFGNRINYKILDPIEPADYSLEDLVEKVKSAIGEAIEYSN